MLPTNLLLLLSVLAPAAGAGPAVEFNRDNGRLAVCR
jgi:hypothetical protein